MKLLLDTHTFIWWSSEPEKLPRNVRSYLDDEVNTPIISVVNIWEMQIKATAGKFDLATPLAEIVKNYTDNDIEFLPITPAHVVALTRLPDIHRDPFDRILVAQAMTEGMTLLSKDPLMKQYPISVLW